MKTNHIVLACALALAAAACSKSANDSGGGAPVVQNTPDGIPEIPVVPLQGSVLGVSWAAKKAGAHKTAEGEVSVSIVADGTDPCTSSGMTTAPLATVVLPEAKNGAEYTTMMSNNQFDAPVVIIDFEASPVLNLISDKSRVRVSNVTASAFDLALYAHATEESARVSEIKGMVSVVRCD